jgi:hypothetical protein
VGHAEEAENLPVVINQPRKKIEKDPAHPRYILTEPWLGYRFHVTRVNHSEIRRFFFISYSNNPVFFL